MVFEGIISPEEGKKIIDDLNAQLKELGLQPISLVLDTREAQDELSKTTKQLNDIKDVTSATGNMFSSLGSAIGGTAGEIMSFAGSAIQGIGEIIPQIISLIGAS